MTSSILNKKELTVVVGGKWHLPSASCVIGTSGAIASGATKGPVQAGIGAAVGYFKYCGGYITVH
jgi:hypothetical protein